MRRKGIAYFICMIMLVTMFSGCGTKKEATEELPPEPVSYERLMDSFKQSAKEDVVTCWYGSEGDKAWLEAAAADFEKEYGIRVNPVYYDGISFFEDMNQANQKGEGPDVYLTGNDQLELATTSGMAEENTWFDDAFWKEHYPETAKGAFNYQGKQYGYPVYFDTYCLVYDANLLETAPASIDDILAFLDEYEDTGSTKAVFRWDVADPYINSMFVASYANLFGENGDDATAFQINNEQCVAAMEYFQSLSAYLWMNKGNISHDIIMNRIKDGTLVLGLCKSDMLPILYEMQAAQPEQEGQGEAQNPEEQETDNQEEEEQGQNEGQEEEEQGQNEGQDEEEQNQNEDQGEEEQGQNEDQNEEEKKDSTNYQVAYVPSLTAELSSTTFSTTYGVMVNPYGKDTSLGNMFALYLSYGNAAKQFAGNGKLPVINQKEGFDAMQSVIYAQYINSKPVPKVMVLGDYLSESGITYDAIWSGENAKEQLDLLQEKMQTKINE